MIFDVRVLLLFRIRLCCLKDIQVIVPEAPLASHIAANGMNIFFL